MGNIYRGTDPAILKEGGGGGLARMPRFGLARMPLEAIKIYH